MIKCAWHLPYHGEDMLARDAEAEANCSHINFYRGCSWPAPDPSGFGRNEIILPRVPFSSVLAEGISRRHWWGVWSYVLWGLSKKASLTHDSRYCSSVAGRSLRVCVHICLFCAMTHRVSGQMFIFQSKVLIFLFHPAHYMWAETFPLLWAFRSTFYLDIFVSR